MAGFDPTPLAAATSYAAEHETPWGRDLAEIVERDFGEEPPWNEALGLVALCNHARRPNARVRRNLAQETLDLLALAPIAAGDEVTIDYNCPLWFEAQD